MTVLIAEQPWGYGHAFSVDTREHIKPLSLKRSSCLIFFCTGIAAAALVLAAPIAALSSLFLCAFAALVGVQRASYGGVLCSPFALLVFFVPWLASVAALAAALHLSVCVGRSLFSFL